MFFSLFRDGRVFITFTKEDLNWCLLMEVGGGGGGVEIKKSRSPLAVEVWMFSYSFSFFLFVSFYNYCA